MNSKASWLFVTAFVLLTSACASLDQEMCAKANWEAIGRHDGRDGLADQSRAIKERCADAGVSMNRADYLRGYRSGLAAFCSKENGKYLGLQGARYDRQCPIALEPVFLEGYNAGRSQYESLSTQRELIASIRTPPRAHHDPGHCDFDMDCRLPSACQDHRCNSTGKACVFDSDCAVQGTCLEHRCDFPRRYRH